MLEELSIRNYRIFRELKIDQLRRINLIAGSNNSGKTSLLEAIFLLAGAGNARMATNVNVMRADLDTGARTIRDFFWKLIFTDLDIDRSIKIKGCYTCHGELTLEIASERQPITEASLSYTDGYAVTDLPDQQALRFQYTGPTGKPIKSHISVQGTEIKLDQPDAIVPLPAVILRSRNVDNQEDAMRLARLRRVKRDHLLLEALQVVEPQLQHIEQNSASGTPIIWGDIGFSELIPLVALGEGLARLARLVLAISAAPDGVVLVDEVENGIHHSAMAKVWRAIDKVSTQLNTQVFATTHSFECVSAAHESLCEDDFRLHRLDVIDNSVRCVTYEPETIAAALRHNLEVR